MSNKLSDMLFSNWFSCICLILGKHKNKICIQGTYFIILFMLAYKKNSDSKCQLMIPCCDSQSY